MSIVTAKLQTPIRPTFRTHQVAGLFDLSLDDLAGERFAHTLTAELPGLDEDWTIGAIVGPSGSGKTTLARAAYGAAVHEPRPWPEDVAVIEALESACKAPTSGRGVEPTNVPLQSVIYDGKHRSPNTLTNGQGFDGQGFDSAPIPFKTLLRTLAAVGLASPPSWLRPYRTLSTGERFRADLARAVLAAQLNLTQRHRGAEEKKSAGNTLRASVTLCEPLPLLVCDEFTSTLDRTVACTASFALAKYLRCSSSPNPKFVCISCHTDFLPWLAPDWILDLANYQGPMTNDQGLLRPYWPRGSLQRPELRL